MAEGNRGCLLPVFVLCALSVAGWFLLTSVFKSEIVEPIVDPPPYSFAQSNSPRFKIQTVNIKVKKHEGFTLCHFSDAHGSFTSRIERGPDEIDCEDGKTKICRGPVTNGIIEDYCPTGSRPNTRDLSKYPNKVSIVVQTGDLQVMRPLEEMKLYKNIDFAYDIFNAMPTDIFVPGNHEFTHGADTLASTFPEGSRAVLLLSNLRLDTVVTKAESYLKKHIRHVVIYQIEATQGGPSRNVCFFGLIMNNLAHYTTLSDNVKVYQDYRRSLEILFNEAKVKKNCFETKATRILATHIGFSEDQKLLNLMKERPIQVASTKIRPAFHIVLGGHSHSQTYVPSSGTVGKNQPQKDPTQQHFILPPRAQTPISHVNAHGSGVGIIAFPLSKTNRPFHVSTYTYIAKGALHNTFLCTAQKQADIFQSRIDAFYADVYRTKLIYWNDETKRSYGKNPTRRACAISMVDYAMHMTNSGSNLCRGGPVRAITGFLGTVQRLEWPSDLVRFDPWLRFAPARENSQLTGLDAFDAVPFFNEMKIFRLRQASNICKVVWHFLQNGNKLGEVAFGGFHVYTRQNDTFLPVYGPAEEVARNGQKFRYDGEGKLAIGVKAKNSWTKAVCSNAGWKIIEGNRVDAIYIVMDDWLWQHERAWFRNSLEKCPELEKLPKMHLPHAILHGLSVEPIGVGTHSGSSISFGSKISYVAPGGR